MRVRHALLAVALATTALAGCASDGDVEITPNPLVPCGSLDTTYTPDLDYAPRVRLHTSNGTFTIAVLFEQVPITAGNFLDLVQRDFYDETRFHMLRPGLFIHGGDPRSGSDERRLWGTGGPAYTIPDEFHQFLRHDDAGTVAMATAQPNSGGSQFLVTLTGLPGLDDHNTVFGEVVEGLNVVREISRTPTDDQNRPKFHAQLHEAEILGRPADPDNATVRLTSYGYDCEQVAEAGGKAEFLVSVRNTGQRIVNGSVSSDVDRLGPGWSVDIRNTDTIAVPAGQTVAYVVDVHVPENTTAGPRTVNLTFADRGSEASTTRELTVHVGTLGGKVKQGDIVVLRYVGVLEDGRPFDTTVEGYTTAQSLTWFKEPPTHLDPIEISLGQGLIPGMTKVAKRGEVGQSMVEAISPEDAYGTENWGRNDLGGRLLLFQVELLPRDQFKGTKPAFPSGG